MFDLLRGAWQRPDSRYAAAASCETGALARWLGILIVRSCVCLPLVVCKLQAQQQYTAHNTTSTSTLVLVLSRLVLRVLCCLVEYVTPNRSAAPILETSHRFSIWQSVCAACAHDVHGGRPDYRYTVGHAACARDVHGEAAWQRADSWVRPREHSTIVHGVRVAATRQDALARGARQGQERRVHSVFTIHEQSAT